VSYFPVLVGIFIIHDRLIEPYRYLKGEEGRRKERTSDKRGYRGFKFN
jgi:hypothetical protein